jgi:hypothetical protein
MVLKPYFCAQSPRAAIRDTIGPLQLSIVLVHVLQINQSMLHLLGEIRVRHVSKIPTTGVICDVECSNNRPPANMHGGLWVTDMHCWSPTSSIQHMLVTPWPFYMHALPPRGPPTHRLEPVVCEPNPRGRLIVCDNKNSSSLVGCMPVPLSETIWRVRQPAYPAMFLTLALTLALIITLTVTVTLSLSLSHVSLYLSLESLTRTYMVGDVHQGDQHIAVKGRAKHTGHQLRTAMNNHQAAQ